MWHLISISTFTWNVGAPNPGARSSHDLQLCLAQLQKTFQQLIEDWRPILASEKEKRARKMREKIVFSARLVLVQKKGRESSWSRQIEQCLVGAWNWGYKKWSSIKLIAYIDSQTSQDPSAHLWSSESDVSQSFRPHFESRAPITIRSEFVISLKN